MQDSHVAQLQGDHHDVSMCLVSPKAVQCNGPGDVEY